MKKILTVLLALSVVFTYTVGTAFAAISADRDPVSEAANKVQTELEKVKVAKTLYLGELNKAAQTNPAQLAVDEGVVYVGIGTASKSWFEINDAQKVLDKVVSEAEELLNKQYAEVINKNYDDDKTLDAALSTISAEDYYGLTNFQTKAESLDGLSDYELSYAKDRYKAVVNAVDPTDYSDIVDESTGESNRSKIVALKEKAIKDIDNASNAYGTNGARVIANTFLTDVSKINTTTEDGYDVADLEAAKAIAVAKVTAAYTEHQANAVAKQNDIIRQNERVNPQTDATRKAIADAQAEIEALNEEYPAAMQLMIDQINAVETKSDVIYWPGGTSAGTIGTIDANYVYTYNSNLSNNPTDAARELAVKKVAKIEELKADAELAKQFIGIEGSKYYTEEAVDKALAEAIKKVYPAEDDVALDKIKIDAMTPAEALSTMINTLINGNSKGKVVIDNKTYDAVATWGKAVDNGDYNYNGSDKVKEAIKELVENTKDALYETTSIDEAEKVFLDAYEQFDAYVTKAEYDAMYAKDGALYSKATTYEEQIKAAATAKDKLVGSSDEYDFDATELANNLIAEMKKATTAAELDSNYAEAIDTIDNLKTVETLTAEAKAMNERALAIKTPVEISQKAEIAALMDDYITFSDYIDLIGSDKAYVLYNVRVKSHLQTIADAEAKAINDAIKAVGTVTVDDAEAVAQIKADKDALDQLVEDYDLTAPTTPTTTTVDKLLSDLSKAQVTEVVNAIATMEMTMSAENIAKIKDLQAKYEALKTTQKAAVDKVDGAYDKYVALGKLAVKYEINSVESLKVVKNHSTAGRTNGKSWIKIMWSTQGDDSYVQGYEIYKSTKKNSGYKYAFTTKNPENKWYKNTAGLKKGTRYYYKVRAIVEVDGQKYTSDWSNKAYRIAK